MRARFTVTARGTLEQAEEALASALEGGVTFEIVATDTPEPGLTRIAFTGDPDCRTRLRLQGWLAATTEPGLVGWGQHDADGFAWTGGGRDWRRTQRWRPDA